MAIIRKYLFGGDAPWSKQDWTTCDDRIRGGKSTSLLSIKPSTPDNTGGHHTQETPDSHAEDDEKTTPSSSAFFHGHLDITTLGGAGFASQRNLTNPARWHLPNYDGLELVIGKSDAKKYALILKDEILPKRPDGRDRSSLNWEYAFIVPEDQAMRECNALRIRWSEFVPTYRGKPKEGVERGLDVASIKKLMFMMRSFFGDQEGDFELEIKSIAAFKIADETAVVPPGEEEDKEEKPRISSKDGAELFTPADKEKEAQKRTRKGRWWGSLFFARLFSCCCGR